MYKANVYERRLEASAVIFGKEKCKPDIPGMESQFLGLQSRYELSWLRRTAGNTLTISM
jgi:hypothetical protein